MGLFKNIVKGAGKVLGAIAKPVLKIAGGLGVPGASLIAEALPDARAKVQDVAAQQLLAAAQSPPLNLNDAIQAGVNAALAIKQAGGTESQAATTANLIQDVAVKPASVALPAIGSSLQYVETLPALGGPPAPVANAFSSSDVKTVLNGALSGAKEGGLDAYLNGTKDGKEQKAAAVDAAGSKMLPYILGGAVLLMIFKGNGR